MKDKTVSAKAKQVLNNCLPCFNRIHFVVITSYIEFPRLYETFESLL